MLDIQTVVTVIIAYYHADPAAVASFYTAAAHLRGSTPLVNAILDGIDLWLIEHTVTAPIPTINEVDSWPNTL